MRRIMLTVLALAVAACAPAAMRIPDVPREPAYKQITVYPMAGGMCLDDENIAILTENVMTLRKYCDDLQRILRDLKSPAGRD